jgi:CubicO group peptidase (beta-lactamase class C family)
MKTKYVRKAVGLLLLAVASLSLCAQSSLPRSTPAAEKVNAQGIAQYVDAFQKDKQDIHSLMIVRHGKVVAEQWFGDNAADKPHALFSVSKTFTATAVGFAVAEGKLKVSDKVISFFPDKLPANVSDNLKALEVRHLLTMSGGHDVEPGAVRSAAEMDWVEGFLAAPFTHAPGTFFVYNSLGTYMLSAIVQQVTGQKLLDYLTPRLFTPLGITGATWDDSPQGINTGGWGLSLKTEDLAKMGLFILQKGKWEGKQLLTAAWFDEATSRQIASLPSGRRPEQITPETKELDWLQGYGYQMWRSRHNSFRADGANGQYILIWPEQDAVIVTTAHVSDMQDELNLIWQYLLPAMQ